jgi:hypothetical protein
LGAYLSTEHKKRKGVDMRSEASKALKNGFELTEQELRRIYDALVQQMERVNTPEAPDLDVKFEVKFRNGVIAEPTTLDEILGLENIGSGKIEKLKIRMEKGIEATKTSILLDFVNIDSDTEIGNNAISYSIVGNDRDWVFITSSQLEERLSRIRKFAPNQLSNKRQTLLLLQLLLLIPFMLVTLLALFSSTESRKVQLLDKINLVESRWKSGDIKDSAEVSLEIAKIQATFNQIPQSLDWESNKWLVFIVVGFVGLIGLALFWAYYFPFYNFLWGDYIKVYERKKSTGKFIVGGIIFALVISVVANYISAILGIGK